METFGDVPVKAFASPSLWQTWLASHHQDPLGIWVKIAKKDSGIKSITYLEALDEALCYGWIDGQKRGYDDKYFLQKFTPRRKRSLWSKINIEKATKLIEDGRMQPPGQLAINAAKADGRWDAAYEPQSSATIPPDLQTFLDTNKQVAEFFATFTKAEQYSVLHKLMTAHSLEIRAKRLAAIQQKLEARQK